MIDYERNKKTIRTAISRIKLRDPKRGKYLEEYIAFDDNMKTLCYSGDKVVLAEVLAKVKVI